MKKPSREKRMGLERTLAEQVPGIGDTMGTAELGKRSPTKGPKHKPRFRSPGKAAPKPAAVAPARPPTLEQQYLQRMNTDLRAKDERGNPMPTLADRVALQGAHAAYGLPQPRKAAVPPTGGRKR